MKFLKKYIEYFKDNPEGYWFKRRLYGLGWTPVKWQGWAVLTVWLLFNIKLFVAIDNQSHSGSDTLYGFSVPLLISLAILIFICYLTGERPKWQWGIPDKSDEK